MDNLMLKRECLTVVGDVEDGDIYFILAFGSPSSRFKAEQIMLEHRRDDEELYDTENMLNALDNSSIEYKMFEDVSGIWI